MKEQPTQTQIKIVKQTWGQLRILEAGLIGEEVKRLINILTCKHLKSLSIIGRHKNRKDLK